MKQLAVFIAGSLLSAGALAECPALPNGLYAQKVVENFDGTCTLIEPRANYNGFAFFVNGDENSACEFFGYGADKGSNVSRAIISPSKDTWLTREKRPVVAKEVIYTLTCRKLSEKGACQRVGKSQQIVCKE